MREQGNVKDGDDGRSRKYSIQIDPVVRRLLVSLSVCPGVHYLAKRTTTASSFIWLGDDRWS